ncbi:histidine kinase [Flavobacteriales bacterium]|nr:histidine kinase [Flavobacteriales bacterium]
MNFNTVYNRLGEKAFPFLFSAVLPLLSILNTVAFRESMTAADIAVRWGLAFGFLLLLWFVVERIVTSVNSISFPIRLGLALIAVAILGTILIYSVSKAFPKVFDNQPLWLATFRLLLGGLIVVAIQGGFRSIRENEKLKTENYALQTENYKAQLDQLRKQVNPHFLFNSLSTLQTLIRKDVSKSEDFIHNLSDIYRQLLHSTESNLSTLYEELKFLKTYIYLLKTRHGSALEVDIDVDEALSHLRLPSFAMQLLVENCTKHNIISKDAPLNVRIKQVGNKITVANNLQLKKNVDSMGVGLDNLQKRYGLMNISDGVRVQSDDYEFKVELKLF